MEFWGGEDVIREIDWSSIFNDGFHGGANILEWDPPAVITDSSASVSSSSSSPKADAFLKNSPDSVPSWTDGIEKLLMEDDDDNKVSPEPSSDYCERFLADLLVDSPADVSGEAVAASSISDPNVTADAFANSEEEEEKEKEKEKVEAAEVDDEADEPISKKQKRYQ